MNDEDDDKVVEEVVLQHTNNNKTEYISSAELVEVGRGVSTSNGTRFLYCCIFSSGIHLVISHVMKFLFHLI